MNGIGGGNEVEGSLSTSEEVITRSTAEEVIAALLPAIGVVVSAKSTRTFDWPDPLTHTPLL